MGANTGILRGTRPVRLPTWVVIGTAAALTAALAVVTLSEDTTTPARAPGVAIAATAGSPDDATEIAQLKAARATGTAFAPAGVAIAATAGSPDDATEIAELKAARATGTAFAPAGEPTLTTDEIAWLKTTRAKAANPFGRHS